MKFDAIGMHPELAANYAVHLIDQAKNPKERIALMLNNTSVPPTIARNTPKILQDGKSIDIFVGELLGLAMVGMFYNWAGEKNGNTYQVMVGVENALKNSVETVLSDGAIWDNQKKAKMLFQQVTAQGYYPEVAINSSMVAKAITDNVSVRYRYPDNCGLIVNVYSKEGRFDFKEISKSCDLSSYREVMVNWYHLPQVDLATTFRLDPREIAEKLNPSSLTVKLERHPIDEEWEYNFDDALHSGH